MVSADFGPAFGRDSAGGAAAKPRARKSAAASDKIAALTAGLRIGSPCRWRLQQWPMIGAAEAGAASGDHRYRLPFLHPSFLLIPPGLAVIAPIHGERVSSPLQGQS